MNKNVLLTGASRGIGKEIALELKSLGYNLFLTAKNKENLENFSKEINAKDFLVCDLSNPLELENLSEFIKKNQIDILINNAGEYFYGEAEKSELNDIYQIFNVNLLSPVFLCSKTVPFMKSQKWGRVINIGSISGVMGEAYASLYSGSKSGLIGFTKALALELAQYNITVNTINPGWVQTDLGKKSIEDSEFSQEETLDMIPQRRFVEPKEVAKLVAYLLSNDARGITGQSINLCAGLSVGV